MLNGIKPTIRVGGGNFNPIADGAYTLQIVDVTMVSGFNKFKGVDEEKLNYQFAVLDDTPQDDGSTSRNRYLWKRCSLSMNEKSWLYKLAKAVYGHDLNKEEMEKFDAESIIGKQVKALVSQSPSSDGATIYNNIMTFSKADKQLEPVEFQAKPSVVEKETTSVASPEEVDPDKLIEEIEKANQKPAKK